METYPEGTEQIPWPEAVWINALGSQHCALVSEPSDLLDGRALAEMTQMIKPPHSVVCSVLSESTVREGLGHSKALCFALSLLQGQRQGRRLMPATYFVYISIKWRQLCCMQ